MSGKTSSTSPRKAVVLPKRGTNGARSFFESWRQINRFFDFVRYLVGNTDRVAEVAHNALLKVYSEEQRQLENAEWEKRRTATDELRTNRQFFLEVIFVRHVENFLSYLANLLFEVFTQRPETLRSSDKVEFADVLRHRSIESLIQELAERKVDNLSYSKFSDLSAFFEERLGVRIGDESEANSISEAIEIRNISVHNRCVKSKRYVTRLGRPDNEIGTVREIYIDDLDRLVPLLAQVVKALDQRASRKLKLRGVRFSIPAARKPSDDNQTGQESTGSQSI